MKKKVKELEKVCSCIKDNKDIDIVINDVRVRLNFVEMYRLDLEKKL